MAFELDPMFHTKTMVKILQSQGVLQYAVKMCEGIIESHPDDFAAHELLGTLKGNAPRVEKNLAPSDEEVTDPGTTLEKLQALEAELEPAESSPFDIGLLSDALIAIDAEKLERSIENALSTAQIPSAEDLRARKIEKLQSLLEKVKERS